VGNGNILLFGETGTGKELLAQYIHAQSPRAGRAYRTVYTQGVPEELVEDRLFGHNRGAYTGASSAVPGEAELANGGTLFIDEFGEIPASVQSKLLRLLDKDIRETQRLGSRQVRRVDLQVVLATNRMELLSAGDFRQDLLYRANADDPIFLPKLQDRPEDIPLLAVHFVRKYETQFRETLGPERREITPEAITALTSHPWPGNVRQLDHAIERAVYRWPKLRILSAAHLVLPTAPPETRQLTRTQADRPAVVRESPPPNELIELLDAVQFDPANPSSWAGLAPNLIRAFVRAYFKLLRAALQVTSRHTASNPEGEVKYHPSMKLMHGSRKVTALGAADEIKRVMRLDKEGEAELLSDSLLRAAYQRVLETRPAKEKRPREG
jgi:transcriptional regulator with GAF, ATPase, and Fis domain